MRLHSGAPFWLVADGLQEMASERPLPATCDVAILGAGITGALVADSLSESGLSVLVLDKRAPACGSTAASTSLLSYEIDVNLVELAEMIGIDDAVRAYRASVRAIDDLERLAKTLPPTESCGFARCPSILLASRRRDREDLEREAELRQRHGLDAAFWTADHAADVYGLPSHGALHTRVAGVLDPVRFTRALLKRATGRGALLFARTPALDVRQDRPGGGGGGGGGGGMVVVTPRGETRARWVVYAMGYEMPKSLRQGMVALHTTYALVTEPLEVLGQWAGRCLVWETQHPYFYMRGTEDRRVIIGGADMPFKDASMRDRFMPSRTRRLEAQLEKWLRDIETDTAFVWAGTFGETRDGLPYIGPMQSCPQALYALGYGANGITFGAVAARVLRDLCLGNTNEDAYLFRLNR